jgi:hypothetical protein
MFSICVAGDVYIVPIRRGRLARIARATNKHSSMKTRMALHVYVDYARIADLRWRGSATFLKMLDAQISYA